MSLTFWFFLLVVQNMSFTWVSRARNSGSYSYHAIAAVFSNGIWFASQFILIENFVEILRESDWRRGIGLGLVYIAGTVVGSVLMQWLAINYLEKGRRKVGSA